MFGLYDKDGLLRFINSDRKACLEYAELFQWNSTQFCLVNLLDNVNICNEINLVLNQVKNNN